MKLVERDTIPKEVATEMLCRPGVRLSGKERKMFMAARETHYTSSATARNDDNKVETRIARRFKAASITQLNKWLPRVVRREFSVQNKQSEVAEKLFLAKEGSKERLLLEKAHAALLETLGHIQCVLRGLEDEIESRQARVP